MEDHLKLLRELIPLPKHPVENKGDWNSAEEAIGFKFPNDYKQFVEEYGRGTLFNLIHVFTPFPKSAKGGIEKAATRIFSDYEIVLKENPGLIPYQLFPEKGGIFPIAQSDNSDELHWLMKGAPNTWGIVAIDLGSVEFHEYKDCSFVQFVTGLASGSINCPLFPSKFLNSLPRFKPFLHGQKS